MRLERLCLSPTKAGPINATTSPILVSHILGTTRLQHCIHEISVVSAMPHAPQQGAVCSQEIAGTIQHVLSRGWVGGCWKATGDDVRGGYLWWAGDQSD